VLREDALDGGKFFNRWEGHCNFHGRRDEHFLRRQWPGASGEGVPPIRLHTAIGMPDNRLLGKKFDDLAEDMLSGAQAHPLQWVGSCATGGLVCPVRYLSCPSA
jgi:hypothetical protein